LQWPDPILLLVVRHLTASQIHNARAKVLDAASLHEDIFADLESDLEHYSIELNFQDHCIFVKLALTDSFAVLNEEATKILKELSRSNSCRFDAFVSLKERDLLYSNKLKAEKNLFLLIDIVIYGPGVLRDSVGEVLSNARIYLQHPCYQEAGTEYDNPHFLKLNALNSNLKHSEDSLTISSPPLESSTLSIADEDLSIDVKTQAQLRRRLVKVFENLTRYKKLERFEADIRITRKLLP
jgi:SWI/SNF-related matrix-associated actin-dependent regulator of chromatin subfamily A3